MADIVLPQTIDAGTPLDADEVQDNFDELASKALNKTGDTLTGTLTARNIIPTTDSTYDLGSNAVRWANLYVDSITGASFNAFGTVAVSGQSDVVADTTNDTLTLVAGTGMTLTTTAASDTVTIAANGRVQAGTSGVNAKQGGVLYQDITTTGNVGTGEDTLWSQAIAANVLATNGDTLRITACGNAASNTNAKTFKFKWGSTTATLVSAEQQSANTRWRLVAEITRTGATSQIVAVNLTGMGSSTTPTIVTTASETLSGAVTTSITGEATSNNDLQRHVALVEYLPSGV